ncbi:hypothetical protein BGW36DRAFT_376628 [Talaromyces proteolyticus]|uniref:Pre-rRNA-processing protein ESF2 n=1 Tax=Talaromyces proteolyticus TaxID=1131652 RepID=A0AAD4KRB6_9EURO|nr:uncharacterized protein BGW36DRAFT_376628 [Talaromyces proteolyticus]KAH8698704.1 hypothetical protein BGW36DRAFT_376628 [Talaromyces proteolyticus]
MSVRKYNEFLDIAPSDDDDSIDGAYNSEEREQVTESKGRAVKRQRTANIQDIFGLQSDEEEFSSEDEDQESRAKIQSKGRNFVQTKPKPASEEEDRHDENEDDEGDNTLLVNTTTEKSAQNTKAVQEKKTGVIYFSSLPPYLKPRALKSLLEGCGFEPITKIFLTPLVQSRKQNNKRKRYTDGWVEFASKKTAKICAETLNATIIGKRGYYHDDIWNMKYLRGFKWEDLMEQSQRERSERDAKKRIEDLRARKEDKVFLAGVEAGRAADGMARKRKEKTKRSAQGKEGNMPEKAPQAIRRTFVQNDVVRMQEDQKVVGEDVKRVLGKIF